MIRELIVSIQFLSLIRGDFVHPNNIKVFDQEVFPTPTANEDKDYWYEVGMDELVQALQQPKINTDIAKNVILFIGDGFGFQSLTGTRIYKGQQNGFSGEEQKLVFEGFPHIGFSKTYNVDYQVPDSAGAATAILTGVKTNQGMVGYDANVRRGNCESMANIYLVPSIFEYSQNQSKRTGFVTNTRVTDGTPSAVYAHIAERDWEVDSKLPQDWQTKCPELKDIAAQLIDSTIGINLNVIMGGGFQAMTPENVSTAEDPVSANLAPRDDGRYLCDEWLSSKISNGEKATLLRNKTALLEMDANEVEYVMGIFSNDDMPFEYLSRNNGYDIPTLSQMTEAAIEILERGVDSPNGYFLMVEGGNIDNAHHYGKANIALDEGYAFDKAVQKALELVDTEETLIIVTADHTHTMSITGYPPRGTIIGGISDVADDDIPYTTLLYADGPGYNYYVDENGDVKRPDPTNDSTTDFDYNQQSGVSTTLESHGGEDVPIYAIGPWSHLFYKTHEQSYIADVMMYASCVGVNMEHCAAGP